MTFLESLETLLESSLSSEAKFAVVMLNLSFGLELLTLLLAGERLEEGLIFFLILMWDLYSFTALSFETYPGDSVKELLRPSGALWLVLPLLVLNSDTTDLPQFVRSEGDLRDLSLDLFLPFFLIWNYLLLLS